MDVTAVASAVTDMKAAQLQNQVAVSVERKTLDAEQSAALQLIQAMGVPGLGQNVDLQA